MLRQAVDTINRSVGHGERRQPKGMSVRSNPRPFTRVTHGAKDVQVIEKDVSNLAAIGVKVASVQELMWSGEVIPGKPHMTFIGTIEQVSAKIESIRRSAKAVDEDSEVDVSSPELRKRDVRMTCSRGRWEVAKLSSTL
ncbi:hypothetical protein CDD83_1059 [Cordyceps sp. RAO-2017]|nr:hypothetical protein CDD83_1059 [Cordyceps sp. RAO-2017]